MQTLFSLSDTNSPICRFTYTLPEIKRVRLKGTSITVQRGSGVSTLASSGPICERLANAVTPEDVVRFTENYGPLTRNHRSDAAGKYVDVTFTLKEWFRLQEIFRLNWKAWSAAGVDAPRVPSTGLQVCQGEQISFTGEGMIYEAQSLLRLLELYAAATPPAYLKICPNPDCKTPFLFSTDLREKLCASPECRAWKHRQASKEYRANGPKRSQSEVR